MPTFERKGVRLTYKQQGEGPPVMLVQGLGMSGRLWLRMPELLQRRGLRVLVPDARGTGASDAPWPPYRMRELAADLAALIRHAKAAPALVVGLSFGGMVAQHLALNHPELVGGLVLGSTTCGLPQGQGPNLRSLALVLAARNGNPSRAAQLQRRLVHPKTLERNPELFNPFAEMNGDEGPMRGVIGQLTAAMTHSTCTALDRIRCPTEVITGDTDRMIPTANSELLARSIPGAQLTVVPEAGHLFTLERPQVLVEAILRVCRRSSRELA